MALNMALVGSLFPLICWVIYAIFVGRFERIRPSLSSLMVVQRRRWVANAVHRDTPLDALLASNLMSSVSFFASTTILLILALFAVFGQISSLTEALAQLQPDSPITTRDIEIHLIAVQVMFILAFMTFTLSIRQFNHFCVMLGAADHMEQSDEREIDAIAKLNALGARYFNQGIRAYYFSIAALAWFVSPMASIVASLLITIFIVHREFFSAARQVVADLGKTERQAKP